MKITRQQLKEIIEEELVLVTEQNWDVTTGEPLSDKAKKQCAEKPECAEKWLRFVPYEKEEKEEKETERCVGPGEECLHPMTSENREQFWGAFQVLRDWAHIDFMDARAEISEAISAQDEKAKAKAEEKANFHKKQYDKFNSLWEKATNDPAGWEKAPLYDILDFYKSYAKARGVEGDLLSADNLKRAAASQKERMANQEKERAESSKRKEEKYAAGEEERAARRRKLQAAEDQMFQHLAQEGRRRLTRQQLKEIIEEELVNTLIEVTGFKPTPEMNAIKHFQGLIDALRDSGQASWAEIIEKLRPELENDLDTEARAAKEYEQDVFTNAPTDYATMQERKLTKDKLRQLIKEELEVILTDDEAKEFFGDDVFENSEVIEEQWRKHLNEDTARGLKNTGFYRGVASEEQAINLMRQNARSVPIFSNIRNGGMVTTDFNAAASYAAPYGVVLEIEINGPHKEHDKPNMVLAENTDDMACSGVYSVKAGSWFDPKEFDRQFKNTR